MGIHELLALTGALRQSINQGAPCETLRTQARKEGMRMLFEDAIEKVAQGLSSFAEALIAAPVEHN